MSVQSKSNSGSSLLMAILLAAGAISSSSQAQPFPTQAERAAEYRAGLGVNSTLGAQRRTHLAAELVTQPTIVRAPAGTTVVTATTAVNPGRVIGVGRGATAAQLDVRCPLAGGRIVMHGNRVINAGDISSVGTDSVAAQVVERCNSPIESSSISQTGFQNYGRIRAGN